MSNKSNKSSEPENFIAQYNLLSEEFIEKYSGNFARIVYDENSKLEYVDFAKKYNELSGNIDWSRISSVQSGQVKEEGVKEDKAFSFKDPYFYYCCELTSGFISKYLWQIDMQALCRSQPEVFTAEFLLENLPKKKDSYDLNGAEQVEYTPEFLLDKNVVTLALRKNKYTARECRNLLELLIDFKQGLLHKQFLHYTGMTEVLLAMFEHQELSNNTIDDLLECDDIMAGHDSFYKTLACNQKFTQASLKKMIDGQAFEFYFKNLTCRNVSVAVEHSGEIRTYISCASLTMPIVLRDPVKHRFFGPIVVHQDKSKVNAKVLDMPEPQHGVVYIVEKEIFDALPLREDVVMFDGKNFIGHFPEPGCSYCDSY